mgnify:CR=1 FL=1
MTNTIKYGTFEINADKIDFDGRKVTVKNARLDVSQKNYCIIFTRTGESFKFRGKLDDIIEFSSVTKKGRDDILNMIGKKVDIVFCGSDYLGTNRFESLYEPESVVYYFDRAEVPISSTDIRAWGVSNWDYIPKVARPYYARKVLVVGGESTGKSTLVENLALCYNTNYVSEVGRETCARCGGEEYMTENEMYENLLRQKINVMDSTATTLCMDNNIPIIVIDINKNGNLKKVIEGKKIGTIVSND